MLQHSQLVKFWPEECCDLVEVLYYHFMREPVFMPFTVLSIFTIIDIGHFQNRFVDKKKKIVQTNIQFTGDIIYW